MHRKAPSRAQQVGTTVPVAALSAACCADSFTRSEINDIYHDRKGGGGEKRERVKMSISYSTAGNFDSSLVFSLSHTLEFRFTHVHLNYIEYVAVQR